MLRQAAIQGELTIMSIMVEHGADPEALFGLAKREKDNKFAASQLSLLSKNNDIKAYAGRYMRIST